MVINRVYPNPSSGLFHFELNQKPVAMKVLDSTGKSVLESTVQNMSGTIDLIDHPNGVYFLQVTSDETRYILKILKDD